MTFSILRLLLASVLLISCRAKSNYEIIGVRENKPTFLATVFARDTMWTDMEKFAKSLVKEKKDKKYKSYSIGFYSRKDKVLKFDSEGNPIVKSFEEAAHAQDYFIASYEITPADPTSEKFTH